MTFNVQILSDICISVRLYYKHDLDKNVHLPGFDNMMIQVDYARDHLEGMKALQGNNG